MAVFVVNSLADTLDPGTLRTALADANATGATDTIQFAVSGTIDLILGELSIASSLTLDGSGQSVVLNAVGAGRVIHVTDGDANPNRDVTIRNLTILNGNVSNAATPNSGGGIRSTERLTLQSVTLSGNHAATGGGIAITGGGSLTMSGATLSGNTAYYQGGALAVFGGATANLSSCTISGNSAGLANASGYSSFGGGVLNLGSMSIMQSTIRNNRVSHLDLANYGAFGGGIANTGSGNLTISASTISGNAGELGGGIHAGTGTTYLQSSTVGGMNSLEGNTGSRGGGVFVTGNLVVMGGTIRNNRTIQLGGVSELGGGIATGAGASSTFDGTLIADNSTAGRGGGIYASAYGSASTSGVTVRNSTISGNSAGDLGGGISAGTSTSIVVERSNIDDNIATNRGGGIYASGFGTPFGASVTIRDNSNVRNNRAVTALGGGVSLGSRTVTLIDQSVFSGNIAETRGGAIYAASFGAAVGPQLTITGGSLLNNRANQAQGGAIAQGINVTTTINGTQIRDNIAATRGGGIFASAFGDVTGTRLTLNNSTVSGNTATAELGGGISLGANVTGRLYGATVSQNTAGTRGGGIYASTYGNASHFVDLRLRDAIVSDNTATTLGGGLHMGSRVTLNAERTQVLRNRAGESGGGAYISGFWDAANNLFPSSDTILRDSTFADNVAENGDGGGIRAGRTTSFIISGSTFSANRTLGFDGGGISLGNAKQTRITNSTFSGNQAMNDGGGLWVDIDPNATSPTGPQSLTIEFSTITGNRADTNQDMVGYGGGGLLVSNGGTIIRNSIVSGNSDGGGQIADFADVLTNAAVDHTLLGSSLGHAVLHGVAGNLVGIAANLGPLANNGGPTKTHYPNPGSPAINAGDPGSLSSTDQRGVARPFGGGFDLGAVEVNGVPMIDGDFNDDTLLDCMDVNALTNAIATGGSVATFDLNGDNVLSVADLDMWLSQAGNNNLGAGRVYRKGDANLDGVVDGSDFGLWNAHKFTANTAWCDGNFNADNVVDGSDFGIWNSNKFTASDEQRPANGVGFGFESGNPTSTPRNSITIKGEFPNVAPVGEHGGDSLVAQAGKSGKLALAPERAAVKDDSAQPSVATFAVPGNVRVDLTRSIKAQPTLSPLSSPANSAKTASTNASTGARRVVTQLINLGRTNRAIPAGRPHLQIAAIERYFASMDE